MIEEHNGICIGAFCPECERAGNERTIKELVVERNALRAKQEEAGKEVAKAWADNKRLLDDVAYLRAENERMTGERNQQIDETMKKYDQISALRSSLAAKDAEIARLREAVEFATRNNVGQVIDSEFARNVRKMAGMEG